MSCGRDRFKHMSEEEPVFKVVDRRPFNPDGSPRELTEQEREEEPSGPPGRRAVENAAAKAMSSQAEPAAQAESTPRPAPSRAERRSALTCRRSGLTIPPAFSA